MDPIEFDDEQLGDLPPHVVQTWAKNQPQYRPLPTVILAGHEGRVISRWRLTDEERGRIAAGEDLYLEQLTFGRPLQPMLPAVGLRDFCPADGVAAPERPPDPPQVAAAVERAVAAPVLVRATLVKRATDDGLCAVHEKYPLGHVITIDLGSAHERELVNSERQVTHTKVVVRTFDPKTGDPTGLLPLELLKVHDS